MDDTSGFVCYGKENYNLIDLRKAVRQSADASNQDSAVYQQLRNNNYMCQSSFRVNVSVY